MAEEPGVRGVELPLRAERDRTVSVHVGLRGAVDPELVREVELSSCSAVYERRVSMDAGRGRDDLFSGLRDPPSLTTSSFSDTCGPAEDGRGS